MLPSPSEPDTASAANSPVQAMVVGDQAFIAGQVCKILDKDSRIEVAVKPADGPEAVRHFRDQEVEVVVMDIGGDPKESLTTISRLLRIDTKAQIIMISTLNFTNVKAGIDGLERGAAEFLQTPALHTNKSSHAVFQHNLIEMVEGLGMARRKAGKRLAKKITQISPSQPIQLRKASLMPPKVLVIGSSTGGPQALMTLFKGLSPSIGIPVLLTQHMPPIFTGALAANITKNTNWNCTEAKDGEIVELGRSFMAPGDYHMSLKKDGDAVRIQLDQSPPVNYCRPSVDTLFRSAAVIYGAKTLAAMLTGMGSDGEQASVAIAEASGTIIAQDEETSVVWGMPGTVAAAGVCSAVLPIEKIAGYLNAFITDKP